MPVVGNWADPVSVPHFKVIDYPNQDPDSPYSRFICRGCLEDCGQKVDQKRTLNCFAAYRVANGGFSNRRGDLVASVNATAAALMVIGQEDVRRMDIARTTIWIICFMFKILPEVSGRMLRHLCLICYRPLRPCLY